MGALFIDTIDSQVTDVSLVYLRLLTLTYPDARTRGPPNGPKMPPPERPSVVSSSLGSSLKKKMMLCVVCVCACVCVRLPWDQGG